jgi:hypothetical protein
MYNTFTQTFGIGVVENAFLWQKLFLYVTRDVPFDIQVVHLKSKPKQKKKEKGKSKPGKRQQKDDEN